MPALSNVQMLRAVAALLVVSAHGASEVQATHPSWPEMLLGNFGVDIFFVISGFIIIYATNRHFGGIASAPNFLFRRLVRVIPLYWIMTTVYIIFMLASHQNIDISFNNVMTSYLFIPNPDTDAYFPLYPLGWTLNYEMLFYLCLCCCIGLPRSMAVCLLSGGFMAAVVVGKLVGLHWPFNIWCDTSILEFVFGMLLAEAYLRRLRLPPWTGVALAVPAVAMLVLTVPSLSAWWSYRGLVWGLPAAALVGAALFRPPQIPRAVRRIMEPLGDASYSIYLVHYLVFVLVEKGLQPIRRPEHIPAFAYACILGTVAIAAALLSYRYIERPLLHWLSRGLIRPGDAKASSVLTGTRDDEAREVVASTRGTVR